MAHPPHSPPTVLGNRPRRGMAAWLVLLLAIGLTGLGLSAGADALVPGDESVAQSEADGDPLSQAVLAGPEGHPSGVLEAAPTVGLPLLTFLLGLPDRSAPALAPSTVSKGCRGHPTGHLS